MNALRRRMPFEYLINERGLICKDPADLRRTTTRQSGKVLTDGDGGTKENLKKTKQKKSASP